MEALISRIERKGIPFREFIAAQESAGHSARFQFEFVEGTGLPILDREFEALRKRMKRRNEARHDETLASIPAGRNHCEMRCSSPTRLHFIELYEEEYLRRLVTSLQDFGFELTNYFIADGYLLKSSKMMDRSTTLPYLA